MKSVYSKRDIELIIFKTGLDKNRSDILDHTDLKKELFMLNLFKPKFDKNVVVANWEYKVLAGEAKPWNNFIAHYESKGYFDSIHPNFGAFARFYWGYSSSQKSGSEGFPSTSYYLLRKLNPNAFVDGQTYFGIMDMFSKEELIGVRSYKIHENGFFLKEDLSLKRI